MPIRFDWFPQKKPMDCGPWAFCVVGRLAEEG